MSRLLLAFALLAALPAAAQNRVIENFESYTPDAAPGRWVFYTSKGEIHPLSRHFAPNEQFLVRSEGGNRFLNLYTKAEAQRITLLTPKHFEWDIDRHPLLRWRWRANKLPAGASEKGQNDTAGAVYVTFGTDWLGRPRSIKYTYSSTLPVGTVVEQGPLRVIVVSSRATGRWQSVVRDVRLDYRSVFGGDAPDPDSITLWSDSDNTKQEASVDIDDLTLMPPV
jgi:hypothetical protein